MAPFLAVLDTKEGPRRGVGSQESRRTEYARSHEARCEGENGEGTPPPLRSSASACLCAHVFPTERHSPISDLDDPVVGDGNAVRIAGEILENVLRASERAFGVNHPILTKQRSKESMESPCFGQWFQTAWKYQCVLTECPLQAGDELAAKHTAQHFDWQKEGIARVDPLRMIIQQTAGWDDTLNVRVMLKILSPGVEHTQETNLCPKMLRIGSDLQQGGGAGAKQQIINHLFVLQASHDS